MFVFIVVERLIRISNYYFYLHCTIIILSLLSIVFIIERNSSLLVGNRYSHFGNVFLNFTGLRAQVNFDVVTIFIRTPLRAIISKYSWLHDGRLKYDCRYSHIIIVLRNMCNKIRFINPIRTTDVGTLTFFVELKRYYILWLGILL